jgi:hypothetical protein
LSLALLIAGVFAINAVTGHGRPASAAADASLLTVEATRGGSGVSRDLDRPVPSPSGGPSPSIEPSTAVASQPAVRLKPVAGLKQAEMDNAVAIVEAARDMKLPKRAAVVALVTALQETHLRNLANRRVPASLNLPHEGIEANFDSIGLFQQRPSQGWGTAAELMDPKTSATLFYDRLVKVANWPNMDVGEAAQMVQRSAFPYEYDKHLARAQVIVEAAY